MKTFFFDLYDNSNTFKFTFQADTNWGIGDEIDGGLDVLDIIVEAKLSDNYFEYSDRVKIRVADRETDNKTIYSGWISKMIPDKYDKLMTITLLPFTDKFSEIPYRSGLNVLVEHTREEVGDIMVDIITKARQVDPKLPPNFVNDLSQINATGNTVSYDANNLTIRRAFDKYKDYAPAYWFWHVDPEDRITFKSKFATKRHIFFKERDLINFDRIGKIEGMKNSVSIQNKQDPILGVFTGKLYGDYNSQDDNTVFTEQIVDDRILLESTADLRASVILDEKSLPLYAYTATIADSNGTEGGYDIEDISVGDTAIIIDYGQIYLPAVWDDTGVRQKWSSIARVPWDSTGVYNNWGQNPWNSGYTGIYFWGENTKYPSRRELIIAQKTYYPDHCDLVFLTRPMTVKRTIKDLKRGLDENKFDDVLNEQLTL